MKKKNKKSILRDSKTGKIIKLPHRNTKACCPISGRKLTLSQWGKAGYDAADRIIKAFNDPTGKTLL